MKKILLVGLILFLGYHFLDKYQSIFLEYFPDMMKKDTRYLIGICLLIMFLESFTTLNILSTITFNTKKFKTYKYLKEGVSSEQYVIERISDASNQTLLYDTLNNTFMVSNIVNLKIIDKFGEIINDIKLTDEINVPFRTHYAFGDTFLYDLSLNELKKEYFKEVIKPPKDMSSNEWIDIFKNYYDKASIVIYGNSLTSKENKRIFFKVDADWILLYMGGRYHLKGDWWSEHTFKGYPAKYNKLILLKDQQNKLYADFQDTTDAQVRRNYGRRFDEKRLKYKALKIKQQAFRKKIIYETIVYTSIPSSVGGTAYYSLKKGKDIIYLKENAVRPVFFLSKVDNYLESYSIPQKFNDKSDISFLKCVYPSNINSSGSKGLYLVKKK